MPVSDQSPGPPVLDYGTKQLDSVPDWNEQAESLIEARKSPSVLADLFVTPATAARYYAKSLSRRYDISHAGGLCMSCNKASDYIVEIGWRVQIAPGLWESLLWHNFLLHSFSPSSPAVPARTVHTICLDCYRKWRRRTQEAVLTIVGIGAFLAALALVIGVLMVLNNRDDPNSFLKAIGFMLIMLCGVALCTGGLLHHSAFGQLPSSLRRIIHPDIWHNGDLKLQRRQVPQNAVVEPMNQEWIDITSTELDALTAIAFVTDSLAGGIDVFLGTTRGERSASGQDLQALDYEAYNEMALQQMRALADRAREKWPIIKLALLHRIGRVAVGEPSVIIAVSTPHRADAFEACRFLIDELKKDIAIWKKEVWSDGSASWVHPHA